MATYRLYRTKRIGDGTARNPYRSALSRYIVDDGSQTFWDWINDAQPVRYALALCESAVHNKLSIDPDVDALSPEFPNIDELQGWLNQPNDFSLRQRKMMADDGIPLDDNRLSRRDVFRFAARCHQVANAVRRTKDRDMIEFISRPASLRINQAPMAGRDRFAQFMLQNGVSTSQMGPATSVGDVIRSVADAIPQSINMGPLTL